ncbi:MAG: hypothetical protein JWS12_253 [Candidatus Saccharibacteria bacterium]|nr:hypothetical protein [Candidatus Saccharibacteria bacterium]
MKKKFSSKIIYISAVLVGSSLLAAPALAARAATASSDAALTTAQQQRLDNIKTRGANEINRRLTALNNVLGRISSASKLSAENKATLTTAVKDEVTGLTTLKSKLAADTALDAAKADAQSVINDYRVYALLLPKVWLLRAVDAEQVSEDKLTALATKLKTRIDAAKPPVPDAQTKLDDMNAKIAAAKTITTNLEAKLLPLQPTDYNSDHTVLSGSLAQIKQAHTDNKAAYDDAKAIRAALK